MAEDSMRAKARATFGSAFMDAAKPRPCAKNYAAGQQKVAQSRPIPTYKVGGAVSQPRGRAMPYEKPSRAMSPAEAEALNKAVKKEAQPAKVTDRMFRGESERGDDMIRKPVKKAMGGPLPQVRQEAARIRAGMAASPMTGMPVYKHGGKVQTSADTARKLATEMGGMKSGGMCGKPGKYAVGGAGKVRKGMAPIKKAQGGAAKVRKGMMTQSGQITPGVKPHKGIGGM